MSGIEYSNDSYCAICDLYFPSVKDRAEHVADSPTHPRCDTCARRFLNGNILRNHYVYSRFHHYCAACRVSFSTAAGLRMHVEHSAVHGDDSDDDDNDEGPSSSSSVTLVEGQEDYLGGLTYPDESSDDEEYGDEYSDGDDSWEHFDECDFEDEEDLGDAVRYDDVDVGVLEDEEEGGDDDDETMIPWSHLLLLLPLSLSPSRVLAIDKTTGVQPALLPNYTPSPSGTWTCLDGSREIPWAFVNDDSCDCADGSDEPGTGACPNGVFYCVNEGHVGAVIPASRVNDGLCERECCDGSDERPGVCENVCREVGEADRKRREEERRLRKTGAKIRATYVQYAHREKQRLEALVESTAKKIEAQEKEVARLRGTFFASFPRSLPSLLLSDATLTLTVRLPTDIADRTESLSQAALEHKQQSPLYLSLLSHASALAALQREHKKHLEREKALGDILHALRAGYNPNYQDMAVLEAVRGWEEVAGLPHVNDVGKDGEQKDGEHAREEEQQQEEEQEEWTPERLETDLDALLNTDYVSLLLEHEEHIRAPHDEGSILFDVSAYLPDALVPQYEELKDAVVRWLRKLGVVRGGGEDTSADSTRARQALTDAENALRSLRDEKKKAEQDAAEMFNVHGFGREGEWKKLDGMCVKKDVGDYTYEMCFFDEARQIPKNGGSTFSLGRFDSWNAAEGVQPGEPEYYKKQVYKHGTRCWNGPERNVVVLLSCGLENALVSVVELEKCEYQFTGTTPALCLPLEAENGDAAARDEL
ncbi:putative low-density lipoprotein receptor domain class A [Lyophyllum shimeji]|uniref:Glucosidase 2 subunit beta n=1 Tax=Lyophyllum shimeji TaxID=47721 RepID=A0A9P3PCL2_LYOSH|nr:putative low-density lipoprotein receptor domain class A [Lyophyllum shimeji]